MTDEQPKNQIPEATETQQYIDKWKRAEANLVNYRKDELKRIQEMLKFGMEGVILDMLDVLDSLDVAVRHVPPDPGLTQVQKQFLHTLQKYGVEKIAAQDQKFDPVLHEAISGTGEAVQEEVRAGYTMHGKVIRPARVVLK